MPNCVKCNRQYTRIQAEHWIREHPEQAEWCEMCVIRWIIARVPDHPTGGGGVTVYNTGGRR